MEIERDNLGEIIEKYEFTDDEKIQRAIDEFYNITKTLFGEGERLTKNEKINHMKVIRNNIINITDTYLNKFNNKLIMKEFYDKLERAKNEAKNNGYIDKYVQYMNEIRVIQEFKGFKETIAEKLAEDFIEKCLKVGEDIDK